MEVEDGTLYRLVIPSGASFNLATSIAKGVKGPVVWAQYLGLPSKVRGGSKSVCGPPDSTSNFRSILTTETHSPCKHTLYCLSSRFLLFSKVLP